MTLFLFFSAGSVCIAALHTISKLAFPCVARQVVKFMQECVWQMLHVMVGLNSIDADPKPRSYTALQGLWKVGPSVQHKGKACPEQGGNET